MEIVPYRVIHEPSLDLWHVPGLVLEDSLLVPTFLQRVGVGVHVTEFRLAGGRLHAACQQRVGAQDLFLLSLLELFQLLLFFLLLFGLV